MEENIFSYGDNVLVCFDINEELQKAVVFSMSNSKKSVWVHLSRGGNECVPVQWVKLTQKGNFEVEND